MCTVLTLKSHRLELREHSKHLKTKKVKQHDSKIQIGTHGQGLKCRFCLVTIYTVGEAVKGLFTSMTLSQSFQNSL